MEVLCCLKGVIGYAFDRWPSVTMTAGCFLVVPVSDVARQVGFTDLPFFMQNLLVYFNSTTA